MVKLNLRFESMQEILQSTIMLTLSSLKRKNKCNRGFLQSNSNEMITKKLGNRHTKANNDRKPEECAVQNQLQYVVYKMYLIGKPFTNFLITRNVELTSTRSSLDYSARAQNV